MWRSVAFQLSATLGPARRAARSWPSTARRPSTSLDAASSLVLFGCLLFVHPDAAGAEHREAVVGEPHRGRPVRPPPAGDPVARSRSTWWPSCSAGPWRCCRSTPPTCCGVGATGFGWMRAMPSLGAITMGLALALLPPMRKAGRALLVAVAAFGAGDHRVRPLDELPPLARGAVLHRRGRQRLGRRPLDGPPAPHAGRDARARGGRQRRLHRDEQRDRRARVGRGGEHPRERGDGRPRRRDDAGDGRRRGARSGRRSGASASLEDLEPPDAQPARPSPPRRLPEAGRVDTGRGARHIHERRAPRWSVQRGARRWDREEAAT